MTARSFLRSTQATGQPSDDVDSAREARDKTQQLEEYMTGKLQPRGPWAKDAACADSDVDPSFFDHLDEDERRDLESSEIARRQRTAASLCRSCPVRTECLQDAFDNNGMGVWGGVLFTGGQPHNLIDLLDAGQLNKKPAGRGRSKPLAA